MQATAKAIYSSKLQLSSGSTPVDFPLRSPATLVFSHCLVPAYQRGYDFSVRGSAEGALRISLMEKAQKLIGPKGVERFELLQLLGINAQSIQTFNLFCANVTRMLEKPAKLFLTDEGNLSILFREKDDSIVELEFFANTIQYFIEQSHEESEIETEKIHDLVKKLSLS